MFICYDKQMKKKAIKLIFINIFFILSLFLVIEYAIYKKAVVDYKNHHNGIAEIIPPPTFFESYKIQYYPQTIQYFNTQKKLDIRPFERNKDNTKKPILIFGCSFANGSTFLEDKQAPAHKLSKLTKRNVYNFAMNGCGLQHMLYITQHCLEKYMTQNEKPEFAIYFYIPNHLQRLQVNIFPNIFFNGTV